MSLHLFLLLLARLVVYAFSGIYFLRRSPQFSYFTAIVVHIASSLRFFLFHCIVLFTQCGYAEGMILQSIFRQLRQCFSTERVRSQFNFRLVLKTFQYTSSFRFNYMGSKLIWFQCRQTQFSKLLFSQSDVILSLLLITCIYFYMSQVAHP